MGLKNLLGIRLHRAGEPWEALQILFLVQCQPLENFKQKTTCYDLHFQKSNQTPSGTLERNTNYQTEREKNEFPIEYPWV